MSNPNAYLTAPLLAVCLLVVGCDKDTQEHLGSPSPGLSLTAVVPASGSTLGATRVTISGTGFEPGAQVSLGGPAQSATFINSTTVTFDTAAHPPGIVDVTVTNPGGVTKTLASGYSYLVPLPPPAVTRIIPTMGSTLGGTWIEIGGTDIRAGASLTVGDAVVSAFFYGGSLYVQSLPPHAAGSVTVTVKNADGQIGSQVDGFTYVEPGALDFNGDWDGGTGYDWQTPVRFTIRNNVVVLATCDGESALAESETSPVINGAFTITKGSAVVMTGRILSDQTATGRIASPRCGNDSWVAGKAGSGSLGVRRARQQARTHPSPMVAPH